MPSRSLSSLLASAFLIALALTLTPANFHAQDKPSGDGAGTGTGGGQSQPTNPPSDGPFRASELTKKAVITAKPQPTFTEEALPNEVEGVVRLRAVLSAPGKVTNVAVLKGLPDGLTEKAFEAASRIKFTPARDKGRPVSVVRQVEYVFSLN